MEDQKPPVKVKRVVGRPIVKGQVLNPLGGKTHDPVKKQLKRLTADALRDVLNDIVLCNPDHIQEVVDNSPTLLKHYIASCLQKGIEKGDMGPLLSILERMIGKVKENVSVENKSIVVNMTPDQVRESMQRANEKF